MDHHVHDTIHRGNELFTEEKYKVIFENTAVAIMVTDKDERIIQWNQYTENLLGMNHEDLFMKEVSSLYPEEEWTKIRSLNLRQKGLEKHLETVMLTKSKCPVHVDLSLSILRDDQGNVQGSIGVVKDISQQKIIEDQRRQEHLLLQSLLDNIPDSIYFKDIDNKFILVNKAKADHYHMNPEDMKGKTDFDFLPHDEAQKAFDDDTKVLRTGEPIIDKIEKLTTQDGSTKWVSVTKIPRKDENGGIIGTIGISRDVTSRIKEEKESEKYKKVAIGQNLRMIELRDTVKELINEMEQEHPKS